MFGCRNDQILPSLYHLYVVVMLSLCHQYMINMSSLLKTDYFCNQMSKTNYPAPNDDWFLGSSAWLFSREENWEGHPLFMGKVDSSQNSWGLHWIWTPTCPPLYDLIFCLHMPSNHSLPFCCYSISIIPYIHTCIHAYQTFNPKQHKHFSTLFFSFETAQSKLLQSAQVWVSQS